MEAISLARYRTRLEAELAEIEAGEALGAEGRKTVELDQQSVGRLSRMDALQGQAMAKATQARRAARRSRIMAALARMDEDEFGYCTDCGEEIAPKRLDLDPTMPTCISCARG
ncbi:TraR/DksA family transcriptional regulator [Sinisalibacter lacisalsi]|uniref:Molecular chaperone DnaK n=1 Tax=Sinisalibacter lacisalsi TaxID=1526570 RepID=A0ABQ1QS36_9RHOB|nr:TraR/DksA C4-type zinc finger protein [Sinisalibacter lacisalsi]GGD40693.1 molecular chaperone DnaK [Sinisalibacter lacisalsi]